MFSQDSGSLTTRMSRNDQQTLRSSVTKPHRLAQTTGRDGIVISGSFQREPNAALLDKPERVRYLEARHAYCGTNHLAKRVEAGASVMEELQLAGRKASGCSWHARVHLAKHLSRLLGFEARCKQRRLRQLVVYFLFARHGNIGPHIAG